MIKKRSTFLILFNLYFVLFSQNVSNDNTINLDSNFLMEKAKLIALVDDGLEQYNSQELSLFYNDIEATLFDKGLYDIIFIKVEINNYSFLEGLFYKEKLIGDSILHNNENIKSYFNILKNEDSLYAYKLKEFIGVNKFEKNKIQYNCKYILAYDLINNRFYKLYGFRVNENKEFIHKCIRTRRVYDDYYNVKRYKQLYKFKRIKTKLLPWLDMMEYEITKEYKRSLQSRDNKDCSCYYRDHPPFRKLFPDHIEL